MYKIFLNSKLEIIYSLFLLSGNIKMFLFHFHISSGPDFTLLTGIFLIVLLLSDCLNHNCSLRYKKSYKTPLLMLLLISILILFSMFYTSSSNYVYIKFFQYLNILLAFFIPLFHHKFRPINFLKIYTIMVVLLTALYIPLFMNSYAMRLADYSSYLDSETKDIYASYLTMGYMMGTAIIILYFSKLFTYKYKYLMLSILFFSLILTGARGPILFILFVLLIGFLVNIKKRPSKRVIISVTILLLFSSIVIYKYVNYSTLMDRTFERLTALENISKDAASSDRLERFNFVIDKMTTSSFLFGYGFGSYGVEYLGKDQRAYPHSILLELLFELGVFSVVMYLLLLLSIIKLFDKQNFLYIGLFIYLILNSLKSSSFTDSRILFGFLAIMIISKCTETKYKISNSVKTKDVY